MSIRFRKRIGPATISKSSLSFRAGTKRAGVSVNTRGRTSTSLRILPGLSIFKRR